MPPKSLPQPAADPPPMTFQLPPLLAERIPCPAPYDAYWVEVVLDVPARELGELKVTTLARVIQKWNFCLASGEPAPVTPEAVTALMDQAQRLGLWLYDEWLQRRMSPLGVRPTPPSSVASPASSA